MATRGVATTVQFVAWDTANQIGKTGDLANFTLRWVKDGVSAAPTNVPATEIDATNAKGVYKIALTAAECTATLGTLCGVSSSTGIVILPVTLAFDQIDFTQAIPTSNTAQTVGDAFNAARAQGFGKWTLSGTTLTLYAGDGTTVVRTFTLDSATAPTQRT